MPSALGLFQTVCSVAPSLDQSAWPLLPNRSTLLDWVSEACSSDLPAVCAVRHGSVQVVLDPRTSRVGRFSLLGVSSSELIETAVEQDGLEAVAVVVQERMIAVLREGTE